MVVELSSASPFGVSQTDRAEPILDTADRVTAVGSGTGEHARLGGEDRTGAPGTVHVERDGQDVDLGVAMASVDADKRYSSEEVEGIAKETLDLGRAGISSELLLGLQAVARLTPLGHRDSVALSVVKYEPLEAEVE